MMSCLLVAIFPHFRHWKQPSSVRVNWLKICSSKFAEKKKSCFTRVYFKSLFTKSEILIYGTGRYALEGSWWSWNVSHKWNSYGWNLSVSQHGFGCVALSLQSFHTSNIQTSLQRNGSVDPDNFQTRLKSKEICIEFISKHSFTKKIVVLIYCFSSLILVSTLHDLAKFFTLNICLGDWSLKATFLSVLTTWSGTFLGMLAKLLNVQTPSCRLRGARFLNLLPQPLLQWM